MAAKKGKQKNKGQNKLKNKCQVKKSISIITLNVNDVNKPIERDCQNG